MYKRQVVERARRKILNQSSMNDAQIVVPLELLTWLTEATQYIYGVLDVSVQTDLRRKVGNITVSVPNGIM